RPLGRHAQPDEGGAGAARPAAACGGAAAAGQARGRRDRPHPRGAGGGRSPRQGAPRRRLSELDSVPAFAEIAPAHGSEAMSRTERPAGELRAAWGRVLAVVSAAVLVGAEVFGAAVAGGCAVGSYLALGASGVHIMQGIFFACGIAVMVAF